MKPVTISFADKRVADINSAYFSAKDLELCLKEDCPGRIGVLDRGYGTIHFVPCDEGEGDSSGLEAFVDRAIRFGLSLNFCNIVWHLFVSGFHYFVIDVDGSDVEGLLRHPKASESASDGPGTKVNLIITLP